MRLGQRLSDGPPRDRSIVHTRLLVDGAHLTVIGRPVNARALDVGTVLQRERLLRVDPVGPPRGGLHRLDLDIVVLRLRLAQPELVIVRWAGQEILDHVGALLLVWVYLRADDLAECIRLWLDQVAA